MSLPLGAVRLRERFLHHYPVDPDTAGCWWRRCASRSRHPLAPYELGARRLIGTGGTATCLAAIHKVLPDFDPRKVDHATFTLEQMRGLLRGFTGKSLHALKQIPGLPPKRADLIIPGSAVLMATMELLGAKRVSVSVRGLRYGVLTDLMAEDPS